MARDLGELNREDFARYKDDVKKEGKGFFPRAILHDTVMSLVVVIVIIGLAAIWKFTISDPIPEGSDKCGVDDAAPCSGWPRLKAFRALSWVCGR